MESTNGPKMTSTVLTTEITPVLSEEEDNQNEKRFSGDDSIEATFSSDSDSDYYLEDNRYVTAADETDVCEEAVQKLKEMFIKNQFNKLQIIQRKRDKNAAKHQMVSHLVITDQKVDESKTAEDIRDQKSKYLFESKAKLLKESELNLKQKSDKIKKNLKTDVQINRIPKKFEEFLELICDLKSDLIEDEKSKLFFREETHNRDIRFQSHDSYVNSFVPFVIREFWSALKTTTKRELISYQMTDQKSERSNELILSHIRHKSCNESVFKFGKLVIIKYTVNQNQDSDQTEVQSYFGVVLDVITELIDKTSDKRTDPLILSQTNSEENDYIYETIYIHCNPFPHTFQSISVTPLTFVQKYLLEARIAYELKEPKFEKIFQQILKPNFKFGNVGFSVNLEHRKELFDIQKDSIQMAYEICCLPPLDGFSSFVAIYGGPKTGKTEVLTEAALQLLTTADQKIDKLIIITTGVNQLNDIIETLKKNEIKVFHIDSDGKCLSHKNSDFRRLIRKEDKNHKFDDIVGKDYSMEQILKFYGGELESTELSVRDKYVKEIIDNRNVIKLIKESKVIIGSIASVMNNEAFNLIYNVNNDNNISCALVDSAHFLTETELWALLYSGVRSFALFGDISQSPVTHEKCESFLKRYVGLYSKNFSKIDSKHSSVLYLRDTIASLQRLANNRGNDRGRGQNSRQFNNRNNNQFGRRNPNQKISEYRNSSNYGSEYFNRNNRYKDNKPFKTESKDGFRSNGADNKPFNRYNPNPEYKNERQETRPGPSQSTSQEQNPMIDGIGAHFAFGSRDTYLSRFNTDFSSPPSDLNRNSDPNANNYPTNGNGFMSNPTSHQNYNLF